MDFRINITYLRTWEPSGLRGAHSFCGCFYYITLFTMTFGEKIQQSSKESRLLKMPSYSIGPFRFRQNLFTITKNGIDFKSQMLECLDK